MGKEDKIEEKSALEYACGTGALTTHLSTKFKHIRAKDLSLGMLEQAKSKTKNRNENIEFLEGDILNITEEENSYDYVFISFALHLFSPLQQEEILGKLISVAREKVMIIDHIRKWQAMTALVEWMEGSFYDKFVNTDFKKMSERLGVKHFYEEKHKDCSVLIFVPS